MGRVLRSGAAVIAGLALVATLPVPCPCPDPAAAPPIGYACCAPPAGVSASDHGCCGAHDHAAANLRRPGAVPAAPPSGVAAARLEPVVRLAVVPNGFIAPSPSPPPAILRI